MRSTEHAAMRRTPSSSLWWKKHDGLGKIDRSSVQKEGFEAEELLRAIRDRIGEEACSRGDADRLVASSRRANFHAVSHASHLALPLLVFLERKILTNSVSGDYLVAVLQGLTLGCVRRIFRGISSPCVNVRLSLSSTAASQ
jgi:hypothetical protein